MSVSKIKKVAVLAWTDRWSISIWRALKKIVDDVDLIYVHDKTPEEVRDLIEKSKPDLCFSKNFRIAQVDGGCHLQRVSEIFSNWKFPTAVWYLDNPRYQDSSVLTDFWKSGSRLGNGLFFFNDPSFKEFFTLHQAKAYHLPIGVDEAIFDLRYPELETQFARDLRFTGHALAACNLPEVTLNMLREGHMSLVMSDLEDRLTQKLKFSSLEATAMTNLLIEPLQKYFSEFYTKPKKYLGKTEAFFKSCQKLLPPDAYAELIVLEPRIGEVYSWWQMTAYLYAMKELGLIVQGDQIWSGFFPDQVESCRELTWEELFASYRATKISFCFTKWSLPYAVHDRIYEVLAAGGFPLTDRRDELDRHFNEDEIVSYETIDEAKDLAAFYIKNDAARLKLIEKGRERVRRDHTYEQRLRTLLDRSAKYFNI